MNADYIYQNNQDKMKFVKFSVEGDFLEVGVEFLQDETLLKMHKMEEVKGWTLMTESMLYGMCKSVSLNAALVSGDSDFIKSHIVYGLVKTAKINKQKAVEILGSKYKETVRMWDFAL